MTTERAITFAENAQLLTDEPVLQEFYRLAGAALRAQQERENSEPKGLFGKYIVRKTSDGTAVDNCFVLRPEKDPAAITAIRAYAEATDNSTLATDLLQWVGEEKPLTLDELREMVGEPVWISEIGTEREYWAIVKEVCDSKGHDGIYLTNVDDTDDYAAFTLYGNTWLAYRHEPKKGA